MTAERPQQRYEEVREIPTRDTRKKFACPECGEHIYAHEWTECSYCGAHLTMCWRVDAPGVVGGGDDG